MLGFVIMLAVVHDMGNSNMVRSAVKCLGRFGELHGVGGQSMRLMQKVGPIPSGEM